MQWIVCFKDNKFVWIHFFGVLFSFIPYRKIMSLKRKADHLGLSAYRDRKFHGNLREQERLLLESNTLYIGNMSFFTTEEQIYELFSRAGDVKRIVMGLDRVKKTPCGFCFVEYYTREDAENSVRYINGTRLDDRIIRTDWDVGFAEGRQYGRGKHGGQVRDEYRQDFDPDRGGWGNAITMKTGHSKKE